VTVASDVEDTADGVGGGEGWRMYCGSGSFGYVIAALRTT